MNVSLENRRLAREASDDIRATGLPWSKADERRLAELFQQVDDEAAARKQDEVPA